MCHCSRYNLLVTGQQQTCAPEGFILSDLPTDEATNQTLLLKLLKRRFVEVPDAFHGSGAVGAEIAAVRLADYND